MEKIKVSCPFCEKELELTVYYEEGLPHIKENHECANFFFDYYYPNYTPLQGFERLSESVVYHFPNYG